MEELIILTDNGKKVLQYMREHDEVLIGKDIGEALNIKGIYPTLTSLCNKGFLYKGEPKIRNFIDKNNVSSPREYKTYALTEMGRAYELD